MVSRARRRPVSESPSSSPVVSVVICTHNPRLDYLERTLEGLRRQTLPTLDWELVVVDNASAEPVGPRLDLTWHGRARCMVEPSLGLTNARLCGIRMTSGPLLILVDDDNVLAPDYLVTAVEIGRSHPFLGAWGGRIFGVYEIPPPAWCLEHVHMLAIRDFAADFWSNTIDDFRSVPCGAGMCIRRIVAELWVADVKARPVALKLGRRGQNLGACEDGHLALLSGKLGLGTGVFRRLSLEHLIPKERMTLEYFTRLAAGHAYSYNLLRHILGQPIPYPAQSGSERLFTLYRRWRTTPAKRAIEIAMEKAYTRSLRDLGLGRR